MTVANVQVTQVLLKRGNTTKSLAYTGPLGEPTMDTDLKSIRIHDGVTPGGYLIGGGGSTYGNTQVAVYLASGNVTSNILTTATVRAGNVRSNSYLYANGVAISFSGVTNQLVSGTATVTLANAATPVLYMPTSSVIQGNSVLTLRSGNTSTISSEIQINPGSFSIISSDQTDPALNSSTGLSASSTMGNPTFEITIADPSSPTSQNWSFDKNGILSLPSGASLYDTPNQSITFGYNAYATPTQGSYSVAVGNFSGRLSQGDSAVAIGNNAGNTSQGAYSIAIGNQAGATGQANRSIILNASSTGISTANIGFYVNPVRNYYDAANTIMMVYNTVTNELSYSNVILATVTATRYSNTNVAAYLPGYTGLIAGTITTGTQTNINQVGVLNSLATAGDVAISGNLTVTGNINFIGNVTNQTVTGNSGQFFGDIYGFGALYAGIGSGYSTPINIALQVSTDYNGYAGVNLQNINRGSQASSDIFLTADNGTVQDGYVDFGLASSTYNYTGFDLIKPNDAYFYVAGNTVTGGGNLIVGTYTNKDIVFVTNGLMTNNEVMRVTAGNVVQIQSNTVSTSATSGALIVAGGVGVVGTVTVANTVVVQGVDLFANVSSLANQIVTANTAMKSYVDTVNTTTNANVVTANTALKSYTDTQITAVTTAWTANAATQATELVNLDLKIISANSYAINNVTGANAAIQALSANVGSYYVWANANVAGLQGQIVGANIAWQANAATQLGLLQATSANIGSYYVYANANVAGLQGQITGSNAAIQSLSANVGGFYTYANATYATAGSGYSDANVAAYLPTYSGNIAATNIATDNYRFANTAPLSFSALVSGAFTATLTTGGVLQAPAVQSNGTITTQGPVVLTYSGVNNTLYKIAAVDVDNLAIYGTRNTYFDTTLLTLNAVGGNATVSGNVVAPNYLFANGVNILSTIGAGTFNGGTVTGTTTFATAARVFVQNTTTATSTTTGALVVTGGIASGDTIVGNAIAVPFGTGQTPTDIQRIILAQTLIA
jgi:hypothetical protein